MTGEDRLYRRAPHAPGGEPGTGPTVAFARSDLTTPWSSDYHTLLELAESCSGAGHGSVGRDVLVGDVPVRWSCRTGVCQTCETTIIVGNVDYRPDPVEAPIDGSVFICCSPPRDDIVLDL